MAAVVRPMLGALLDEDVPAALTDEIILEAVRT
jgi:hypothetical protein